MVDGCKSKKIKPLISQPVEICSFAIDEKDNRVFGGKSQLVSPASCSTKLHRYIEAKNASFIVLNCFETCTFQKLYIICVRIRIWF